MHQHTFKYYVFNSTKVDTCFNYWLQTVDEHLVIVIGLLNTKSMYYIMIIELLREDQGCLICSIRPIYEVFYAVFFLL